MTLFAAALRLCGLSQQEAADFFLVRLDTVKSWSAGRNRVPDGAWSQLRNLYRQQRRAADEALQLLGEADPPPDEITLNMSGPRASEWPGGSGAAVNAMVALGTDLPLCRAG